MLKKTLYFGNPAYLYTHLEQLVIEQPGRNEKTVRSIEDLGFVVIDHPQITITQALLSKLINNNTAVIACDERHLPSGLFMPLAGHTLQAARFQAQITCSLPLKKQLWQQTVRAKILNQAALLERFHKNAARLYHLAGEVKSGDADNREGVAAAYYWQLLFDLPETDEAFERNYFSRDRFGEPPNNFLNYGYAVLRAVVARALVGSGLLPTLGIFHRNQYNAYALADDIMEPYRPFVDQLAYKIWHEMGSETELTPLIKQQILGLISMDVLLEGHKSPLMVAASRTTASLAKCFEGQSRHLIYPELP